MLKRVVMGASKFMPSDCCQAKCEPVTIEHLKSLHHGLVLSNSFNIAIFAIACVAFWCCSRSFSFIICHAFTHLLVDWVSFWLIHSSTLLCMYLVLLTSNVALLLMASNT